MQAVLTQTFQTLMRPARAGQAIILIALGFVALIGFTGIATDTGLLFIRYTTLSRATDSAAVAAAATLRQGTDYLSMVNAATHFLVLHGISATSVLVETCATDIQKYEQSQGITTPTSTDDQNAYQALIGTPGEVLCTRGAAKLVKVSAQATAQTTFLSLFGFNNIALTASSVSQAASLDAVVLLDSSYSQAYDTRDTVRTAYATSGITAYDNFADFTSGGDNSGLSLAPYNASNVNPTNPTGGPAAGSPNGSIRAECRWPTVNANPTGAHNLGPNVYDALGNVTNDTTDPNGPGNGSTYQPNFYYGGCCNAPANVSLPAAGSYDLSAWVDKATGFYIGTTNGKTIDGQDPELVGGITFNTLGVGQNATGDLRTLYEIAGTPTRTFANRNYISLICMPFRDVRRGAYTFLQNVNFQAGDRTFMVTYDTSVHELTVAGEYNDSTDFPAATGAFPGITSRDQAVYTLYRYAGVESSATGFQAGCPSLKAPPYNYNGWGQAPPGATNDLFDLTTSTTAKGTLLYETAAPCTDTNTGGAVLAGQSLLTNPQWIRRDAVWVMIVMSAGWPNHTPGQGQVGNGARTPAQPNIGVISGTFFTAYPPSTNAWGGVSTTQQRDIQDPGFCPWATFCDFKTANANAVNSVGKQKEALPDTKKYEYTTQALMSGASNPNVAIPNGLAENSAYCTAANGLPQANPLWWVDTLNAPGQQAKLNSWGGSDNNPSANYNDWQITASYRTDCTTPDPDVRHFCLNPDTGIVNDTTVPVAQACDPNYSGMDFARDMVDYAALDQWTSKQKGNFITMYSIFFPRSISNYPSRPDPNNGGASEGDIGAYILGAKFMRYVADAGDNGTIDNHVQSWYLKQWNLNPNWLGSSTAPAAPANYNGTNAAYGTAAEDPCAVYDFDENPGGYSNNPRTLPSMFNLPDGGIAHHVDPSGAYPKGNGYEDLYRYNCGNYYYAGNVQAVQQAFLSISNRLFVQIAH